MSPSKILLSLLFLACALLACFSIYKLQGFHRTYRAGQREYQDLIRYVEEKNISRNDQTSKSSCPISVDFDSLRRINPEIKGWIYIPGTGISYPVLQTTDNSTYLHMTFKKKKSYVGAIFLDAGCQPDFTSFNSIIYGHNLKNGEMFGKLKRLYDLNYNSKADYRTHPCFWIITPSDSRKYRIFAFREINARADREVYTIELPEAEDRQAFLDDQVSKSQRNTGIRPEAGDTIVTLSTCSSDGADGRFVIQAVVK